MSKIRSLRVRVVRVPMAHPHRTASGVVSESPLVLTDVFTDDGVVGHSVVFTYTAAALEAHGRPDPEPRGAHPGRAAGPGRDRAEALQKVPAARHPGARRHRSGRDRHGALGRAGPPARHSRSSGCSAVSRSRSRPTGRWDTTGRRAPPGSRRTGPSAGSKGVKAKIGYPTVQEDVAVIRAIRKAVGDGVAIMVDYNQCLTPVEAVERLRVLDDEGLTWVEEPTLAHDYAGHARDRPRGEDPDPVR